MSLLAIPHLGFIVAAFGITAVVIGAAVAMIVTEHRRLKRDLARLSLKPVGRQAPPDRAA